MVTELPREVPQPGHGLEEFFHGGPPWLVVAGNRAELCLRHLRQQPGREDFRPLGAGRTPRGDRQRAVPGREVSGCLWYRLAVVGPEEPQVGAADVHVYRGLFPATAEEALLWDDGDAGEPLLPGAEPALHRRVAIPGPQRSVVGGCRGEVPGVDVGRAVGRAHGFVSSMRRCVAQLCLMGHCAKRPHGGGLQVEVAVTAGDDELGVTGARQSVLQEDVLKRCPVRLVNQRVAVVGGGSGKPERVFGMRSAQAQAVLRPLHGHLVDCLRCSRGDSCGPMAVRVPQEVDDDLRVHCMDPRPVGAILQGEGGGQPLPVGYHARNDHSSRAA